MKTDTNPAAPDIWSESDAAKPGLRSPDADAAGRPGVSGQSRGATTLPMPDWKRSLDLILIVLALPILLPVGLALALWIRLVSRGPILFRQERVGHGGEVFTIYKFRSMKESVDTGVHTEHVRRLMESDSEMVKLDKLGDCRLIAGGSLLRNSGLDELPQLLNVLHGEMSLVGPRPCLREEYELYTPEDRERFAVHPGLTGYWQVKGKNKTRFSEMIAMDVHYVRERSLSLDLFIMLATPWALLKQILQSSPSSTARTSPTAPERAEPDHDVSEVHC